MNNLKLVVEHIDRNCGYTKTLQQWTVEIDNLCRRQRLTKRQVGQMFKALKTKYKIEKRSTPIMYCFSKLT